MINTRHNPLSSKGTDVNFIRNEKCLTFFDREVQVLKSFLCKNKNLRSGSK